jgi:hypothetical protein
MNIGTTMRVDTANRGTHAVVSRVKCKIKCGLVVTFTVGLRRSDQRWKILSVGNASRDGVMVDAGEIPTPVRATGIPAITQSWITFQECEKWCRAQ